MPIPGLTLLQDYGTNEEENLGFTNNIAAHVGGGPGSATVIKTKHNRISSSGDVGIVHASVILQKAAVTGLEYYLFNDTANLVSAFTHSASNLGNIPIGQIMWVRSVAPNKWGVSFMSKVNE